MLQEIYEYQSMETWYLTDLVRQGRLEQISRGIYLNPSYIKGKAVVHSIRKNWYDIGIKN